MTFILFVYKRIIFALSIINVRSFKEMVKQISIVLLNTNKKLRKLILQKELLTTYRNVKRYPKALISN